MGVLKCEKKNSVSLVRESKLSIWEYRERPIAIQRACWKATVVTRGFFFSFFFSSFFAVLQLVVCGRTAACWLKLQTCSVKGDFTHRYSCSLAIVAS